jgi:hypothetical protein
LQIRRKDRVHIIDTDRVFIKSNSIF